MKKIIKVFLAVVLMVILALGGFAFYLTRGLESGEALALSGISFSKLEDGKYTGKYSGGRWSNEVMVTVEGGKISDIDVIKPVLFERPEITEQLLDKVINEQTTAIDGISGATVTCKAYLKSIENAFKENK